MFDMALITPSSFEVVNTTSREGVLTFVGGTNNYEVYLERDGFNLFALNSVLGVRVKDGKSGGEQVVRVTPSGEGVMPQNFEQPLELMFSYSENEDATNWLGQSDLGVRDFKNFKIDHSDTRFFTKDKNGRLFSFEGNLYYLCEYYDVTNQEYSNFINIYRYNENLETFFLQKRLLDFEIDNFLISSTYQYSSPDFFEIQGNPYLAFRRVNRNTGKNEIVVVKSDEFMLDWEFVSITPIENSSLEYKDFRLRAVYENETLMIVTCGVYDYERTSLEIVERVDMRSFVSYNQGILVETKFQNLGNVSIDPFSGEVKTFEGPRSLHNMFIPILPSGQTENQLTGFDANFALYYDEDMASFVIMRGGQPDFGNNKTYLMAIKTVENDYSAWESCLNIRLNVAFHGEGTTLTGEDYNPYFEGGLDTDEQTYSIGDIDICVDGPQKVVVCQVESKNFVTTPFTQTASFMAQFRFVEDGLIKPGLYDNIFGYGSKDHDRFSFVSTLMSKNDTGPNPSAGQTNGIRGTKPLVCKHKNMVVSTNRIYSELDDGEDAYTFLSFHKPWSNIGEWHDYVVSYHTSDPTFQKYNFLSQVSGTILGTVSYTSDGTYNFISNSADSAAYLAMGIYPGTIYHPTVLDNVSVSEPYYFKAKFGVSFTTIPASGELTLFRMFASGNGLELRLQTDQTIEVYDPDGISYGALVSSTFNNNQHYEFLVGCGRNRNGNDVTFVYWRERGSNVWTFGSIDATNDALNTTDSFGIGLVEGFDSGQTVTLYDVHLSAIGKNYRTTYDSDKLNQPSYLEGTGLWPLVSDNFTDEFTSRGAEVYDNVLDLSDGSRVSFVGSFDRDLGEDYKLERSYSPNSERNLFDGTAFHPFDFTSYVSAQTYEVFFQQQDEAKLDAVSCIAMFGIYGFTLTVGNYDFNTSTWSNEVAYDFMVNSEILDVDSYSNSLLLVDNNYEDHSLEGYNIFEYDTVSLEYVDQYFVRDNFDGVIQLDKPVSTLIDREYHLMDHAQSWTWPDYTLPSGDIYWSVVFYTPSNFSLASVGQLVLGRVLDISNCLTSMSNSISTTNKVIDSQTNYQYMSEVQKGAYIETFELGFTGLSFVDDEANRILSILSEFWSDEKNFILIQSTDSGNFNHFGSLGGEIAHSVAGNFTDVAVPFLKQGYLPKSFSRQNLLGPELEIEASDGEVVTSETINFYAVAKDDKPGLTYLWDFGDMTTSINQNPIKSYASEGVYRVSCTVTDSDGLTDTRYLEVIVNELSIASYSATTPISPPAGVDTTFTFQAIDRNLAPVSDSVMVIILTEATGNVLIDADNDGSFDSNSRRLVSGSANITVNATVPGTYTFVLRDLNGVYVSFDVTFV